MKNSKSWLQIALPAAIALCLSACPINLKGDDDDDTSGKDGGTGKPTTGSNDGIDKSRDATGLSSGEAQQLCESVMSSQTLEQSCTVAAVHVSTTQRACEQYKSQCLAQGPDSRQQDETCDGADIMKSLSACSSVTIGEIKDCFATQYASEAKLTCADAGKSLTPPACLLSLAKRCPGAFGDDDEGGKMTGGGDFKPPPGYDEDGGLPYPPFPPVDGGVPGANSQCPAGAYDASGVDCSVFCAAVTAPKCSSGPSALECQGACEAAKFQCPSAIGALAGCSAAAIKSNRPWGCDGGGKPRIEGACDRELGCFSACLGGPMQMQMQPPMMPPPPPNP